jgi:hypothetical protein
MRREAALAEVVEVPAALAEEVEVPAALAEEVEPVKIMIEERPPEPGIRFAEDIFPAVPKPQAKVRKERKKKPRPEARVGDVEGRARVKPAVAQPEEEEEGL